MPSKKYNSVLAANSAKSAAQVPWPQSVAYK